MIAYHSPYITCRGWSMSPALRDGDGLALVPCRGPDGLKPGDIIVYPHPDESADVAHRVVRILPDGVITRGDANDRDDPRTVPWAAIKGKVVAVKTGTSFPFLSQGPSPEAPCGPRPYAKPFLLPLTSNPQAALACMNGNEASGNACVSGPEASGGCKSGAAASSPCLDGAAAGFSCKTGTGN